MGPFTEVVVGATDVVATTSFLGAFGFVAVDEVRVDAPESSALFGLDGAITAVRVASAARRDAATLLVVPTPHAGIGATGWTPGPRALDVYTADLDATIAAAADGGWAVSPIGRLAAGPMTMRQAMVSGPGELQVVFVETTHRRSSVLDADHAPAHSEPHSVVWVVGDHGAEVDWWTTGGWTAEGRWDDGFVAGATISFSEPSISDELGLDERPTPITMTMISDAAVEPVRLELMTFDDHRRSPAPDEPRHLASGVFALGVTGGGGDAARLVRSPGGVRVVLRP